MLNIKNPLVPVSITTIFLVGYTLVSRLTHWADLMLFMYFLSPFVVLWMVVRVLKGKGPSSEEPFPYD
ncbi:MAG: hypothetical protein EOO01_13005 [Chitinophagaceae bacterium]|nr:MAG: hypothetical protein EOO01_13005 [Chitinophagaceae bacterium]